MPMAVGGDDAGRAAGGGASRVVLQDFNGPAVPVNQAGDTYPSAYHSVSRGGGAATVGRDGADVVEGRGSLRFEVTSGQLYAQFNPYGKRARGFARDYAVDRAAWRFNTYNRMSFWVQVPTNGVPMADGGRFNGEFGTYVKRVTDPDPRSDEAGGNHYYHMLNLPNLGLWTKVVLNMHPDHQRGDSGGLDRGVMTYPTAGPGGDPPGRYNYFDTLTRFYLTDNAKVARPYPATYRLDEITCYREEADEADARAYTLAATHDPRSNRLIVTWNRAKHDNTTTHEVRYAFSDIHKLGWSAAKPAPGGTLKPQGWQGYNGMVYDTKAIPLEGREVVYVAIKPRGSDRFSQIALPLKKGPARSGPTPAKEKGRR